MATPPGRGGIGCLRLSGAEASRIAALLFHPAALGPAVNALRFGHFLGRDGTVVDHGYLVTFEPGAAYTGEFTAELWTHGSPAVQKELLAAALVAGALAAGPGEFTYRALRNGRIDLARAEAVADLIAARTAYQARTAFSQLEGSLSRRLQPLRDGLADLMARVEAAVEFVDESETHLAAGQLDAGLEAIRIRCRELLSGFRAGRLVREGATLVISGAPNVGKSSLFNRLLERDRAIVTATPGTTRDTLEESIDIGGVPVRLVDTAGLRETADPVEGEGVRRARAALREADLILHVLDGSRLAPRPTELQHLEQPVFPPEQGSTGATIVANKADLIDGDRPVLPAGALWVSAVTGEGIQALREVLRGRLLGSGPHDDPVLTNVRHAAALEQAALSLERAASVHQSGFTEEILVDELRHAMDQVGSITGEFSTEDLLERVFSTFCIGK